MPKELIIRPDGESETSPTTPISPGSYISEGYSSGSSATVPILEDHNHDESRRDSAKAHASSASGVVDQTPSSLEDTGGCPSSSASHSHTQTSPSGLSMPQGENDAIINKVASCGQLGVLVPVTMTSRSDGHNQFHPTVISIEDRFGHSDRHPSIVIPSEPDVASAAMHFQGAHISGNARFTNVGGDYVSTTVNNYGATNGLKELKRFVSFEAQFDSSSQDPERRCHPGTRKNVLRRLQDWFDNPNSIERICWLYGPAGAGKSAIAQTIARSCARPKVAASFFFFRSDVNRNDGNRLFTTLAYQLAWSMPDIRDYIAQSLSERPDLPTTDVETQFDQLLARPFHVLSADATQQLAPAVHIIKEIVKKYKELAPVIIIDGVDECTDENLQRRFLKAISDAVGDTRFPIRFLIVSRPELHIEQAIRRSQSPILRMDLAELDDANSDINQYLVDQFSRIVSEQGLDPIWPGQEIIDDIVYKSSGNFIFASLVIRFIGDIYSFAKTQLDIVLNMKPPKMMLPFAVLDQLFLEILERVPDQDFLKRYLALLVARISISSDYGELHKDDAVLMHVSEQELHANLRRMRSLLEFKPFIDLHHKSFLDFLKDSSRSGQYFIGGPGGIKRYLAVLVDSLVRYVSTVIKHPNHHQAPHFNPKFREILKQYPQKIKLPVDDWQELMRPLLDLQDELLQLPNLASSCVILPCDGCTVFALLRELLHLGLHLGNFEGEPDAASVGGAQLVRNVRKRRGVIFSITTQTKENINDNDLDSTFLSLLANLHNTMENMSLNDEIIDLMSALLRHDYSETATRIRFVSDAQKLVDLLVHLIDEKNTLIRIHPDATRKATLLAFEIFARVPILPLSFFLNENNEPLHHSWMYKTLPIQILSQTILAGMILDRHYTVPVLGLKEKHGLVMLSGDGGYMNNLSIKHRQAFGEFTPGSVIAMQIMLGLAKVIQYLHSMGVVLYHQFSSYDVFLDSSLRPRIRCLVSTSPFLLDMQYKEWFSPEDNVFSLGCILYELYSDVDMSSFQIEDRRGTITKRPSVPSIPEDIWQLIQRCCAEDPKSRPIVDEIVKEMEGW